MNKTYIKVKVANEGTHYWHDAPVEVCYLRNNHRHTFTVILTQLVTHSDRDIEFIMLKHRVREFLDNRYRNLYGVWEFGAMSCEHIAEQVNNQFPSVSVEVWEDDEFAGVVVYND